jgi:ribosome-associated toxin RatA of RatAB toxin-antitoxin module
LAEKDYEELDGATCARLHRGEVLVETAEVPGSNTPSVVVRGVVEATPERVWAIIDDTANYSKNLTGLKRSEEISRQGEVVRVRVTVGMPFPLKNLTSMTEGVHTVVPGERYSRVWKLLEGDYHHNAGSWTLVPFDGAAGRTFVIYKLHAEPKIRIPKKIQMLVQKKAAPEIIEKLRKVVR